MRSCIRNELFAKAIWPGRQTNFTIPERGEIRLSVTITQFVMCCDANVRIYLVCAHLMNIAVDIYGGIPGSSAVHGTRNASHMNVGEQYASVRVGRHRANT